MKKSKKRNLIIFIVITLTSGWIGALLDLVLKEQPQGNSLGMGLWLILPLTSVLIIRTSERDWKDMGLRPNLKSGFKWYALAFLLYPVVTVVTFIPAMIFNCVDLSVFNLDTFISLALFSIVGGFLKNIFEEFSWRGYLTPRLIGLKLNDWAIYGICGLVWSLWHAAYYMVFLPDIYFQTISRAGMIAVGCVLMTSWTVMYVELYRLSKSVWPCVLMHAVEDAVPTVLVATGSFLTFTELGDILFNPVSGIIATILFVVTGLYLRRLRIKINSSAGEEIL